MLAAMTHPSRVLDLDIKAEAFFYAKELYLTADRTAMIVYNDDEKYAL